MKINELAKQKNTNINQIATSLKLEQKTLNNYAKDKTPKAIDIMIKLADYFNVSLDYICERQYNNQIGYIPEEKKEVIKLILLLNNENTFKTFGFVSGLLAEQK